MNRMGSVFRFGAPYLKRYWGRLVAGVLLGVIFGLFNGAILGASKTLLNRVFPEEKTLLTESPKNDKKLSAFKEQLLVVRDKLTSAVDPWLPLAGRPLEKKQIIGLLLLFPALFAFRGYIGYLSSYCMAWVSERVVSDLRQDVFKKLSSLSLDFYNRSTMGDLLNHVTYDTSRPTVTIN